MRVNFFECISEKKFDLYSGLYHNHTEKVLEGILGQSAKEQALEVVLHQIQVLQRKSCGCRDHDSRLYRLPGRTPAWQMNGHFLEEIQHLAQELYGIVMFLTVELTHCKAFLTRYH